MTSLQVHVFGKLRLQHGEARVETFPTRRVEELLGYLILNPKTRHTREKLIDTLWPDIPLRNGRASLSTALWRLRTVFDRLKLLSGDFLITNRDWIRFEPSDALILDLAQFNQFIDEAERLEDGQKREMALRSAIELYDGSFCEGIYAEWCLIQRERFERSYLRAMGKLMGLLMQRQEFDEAAGIGHDILQRDPLREEVHRALMHCYWKMGRRSKAVSQFQNCAHSLQSELRILPMPETIALYQEIVSERLVELRENGRGTAIFDYGIDQAYEVFLKAVEDLNSLLEKAEGLSEERVTA
jgi:DNA-binding SARP family transcriptional activator